jgi:hypothetical protein
MLTIGHIASVIVYRNRGLGKTDFEEKLGRTAKNNDSWQVNVSFQCRFEDATIENSESEIDSYCRAVK